MAAFGFWEWALILIIIILVFGVGRLTKIGKELGKAVSEFRKAFRGEPGKDESERLDQSQEKPGEKK